MNNKSNDRVFGYIFADIIRSTFKKRKAKIVRKKKLTKSSAG